VLARLGISTAGEVPGLTVLLLTRHQTCVLGDVAVDHVSRDSGRVEINSALLNERE
jgi:hypothetical protein